MSEQVMVLGKVNKGISKNSSVQAYESAWLGRWTQLGNEVKFHDQSNGDTKCSKELIRPESVEQVEVLPVPMFKVSHSTRMLQAYPVMETKSSFEDVGSSSKAKANRMPWMYAQEKTTQNLLELIRPVRIYATVDSVQRVSGGNNLREEDGHQLKLKGKCFGGYLDLFPNLDHQHKGVNLQSLESSEATEEDAPRKNESSEKTDTLEMDRLQMIHLSGSISSSSTKILFNLPDSAIPRTEIPDMNKEPPMVPDRDNSVDGHQGETSNSATKSMIVDHFLPRECKRVRLESEWEPGSRWVKRLKTNASDSSRLDETKSLMKIEEASLGQKGKNSIFQPRNQEPGTSQIKNLNQGGQDITLLHPWIQRWCKKKATSTNQPEGQDVSFEPENQRELEKKQHPSIAAMALMGKALSGFKPCGFRKTDSLIVWNAQDLR